MSNLQKLNIKILNAQNWVTLNWVTLIDIKTNVVQSYPYPGDNFEHTRYLKKKKLNIIQTKKL